MSNQFYKYLTKKIVSFFSSRQLKSGDRFSIQFENEFQVRELYNTLLQYPNVEKFEYYNEDGILTYETFCIITDGLRIIVSATIDGIQPDFMTLLRNKVGTEGQFINTCILFIHHTTLDSLIKGAESLHKEGMPINIKTVVGDINKVIHNSRLSKTDKLLMERVLEHKNKEIFDDASSIFEYEYLLNAIQNSTLTYENYIDFGLFYDADLDTVPVAQAKERIKLNFFLFSTVDKIHKYGNPDEDLEKFFDDKGIEKLKAKDWEKTDFRYVVDSYENKKNASVIGYIEKEKKLTEEGLVYWERPEAESKAKSRIRNITIFNRERLEKIAIEFNFDDYTKSQYIIDDDKKISSSSQAGKKIRTIINHSVGKTTFCKVTYKDEDVKYEFRIAVVECTENILSDIKSCYTVNYIKSKDRFIAINTDDDKLVLNPKAIQPIEETIKEYCVDVQLLSENQSLTLIKELDEQDNEHEFIRIQLDYCNSVIPLALREQIEKPDEITGIKAWKLKREHKLNFEYKDNNKFVHGTKEYYAKKDFKYHIDLELKIIEDEGLYFIENDERKIESEEINIDSELRKLYLDLIKYYKVRGLLPSLTYMDGALRVLSVKYVSKFIELVSDIQDSVPLNSSQRDLIKLGTIERTIEEKEIIFTPLHPLNVAYQVVLNDVIGNDEIDDNYLKRLSPINLLPYINSDYDKIYKPIEQQVAPEWSYYVNYKIPRYKGSRAYVARLAKDKISEFVEHFSYLFINNSSPIILKLINLGDCKEILQGIIEYYLSELNSKKKLKELLPISLYIYSEGNTTNVFEEISFYNDTQQVKDEFGIRLDSDIYTEEEILNIFREKVHFYMKDNSCQDYEYCHIAFYQMDHHVKETYGKMADISSGVSLDGLMSGVPSVYIGDSYRTGFGTKFMSENNNILLDLSVKLNSLARTARKLDPYNHSECIITAISEKDKKSLDQVYNTSHWVTFIEPKVDLNFFKPEDEANDLLIIHYSDQYTSSSGYDAITVTRRSKQYQAIIEEYLLQKNLTVHEGEITKVIDLFNALNGDWLLRMISYNNHFPKEKLSILSAVKISLAYFFHPDIIWIPVSLEEILRISGGTGLSKGDGLFSAKSLGVKGRLSDDILLIGIQEKDDKIKVHYYPIEVKIGENEANVINKAVEQAQKTRNLLDEKLNDSKYISVLYRNFLIQLAIVSAEKMKLYDIWPQQNWDKIINSSVRMKLLNNDYDISNELDWFIGRGAVLSFKKHAYDRTMKMQDDIRVITLIENDGYTNILKDMENLKEYYVNGTCDLSQDEMLINKYKASNISEDEVQTETNISTNSDAETITTAVEEVISETKKEIPVKKEEMKILFGHSKLDNIPVYWYPTSTHKVMHTNTGIIGTMGTGKTQFTKSLITQLYTNSVNNVNGTKIGIIIFDYKGDYIKPDFVEATNAKVYKLFNLPYNPLALFLTDNPKPLLPLHTADNLKETISTAFNLGHVQKNSLRELILEAYKKRGIDISDESTWNRFPPTIEDVYSIYKDRENVKEDSLYSALADLSLFRIFESDPSKTKPLFEIIDGVTVIDLSGNNETIQNLVVAVTLDIFYNQMQVTGHSVIDGNYREITKMILVDEADNFLSKDFRAIKKIMKEGREFGVGTILSTQLLSHFSTGDNEYENYISTWVVHRVTDVSNKDVRYIYNTQSKAEEDSILNKVKQLEKHNSMVKLDGKVEPVLIKDKAFWELVNK